jgi:hypothetical protein
MSYTQNKKSKQPNKGFPKRRFANRVYKRLDPSSHQVIRKWKNIKPADRRPAVGLTWQKRPLHDTNPLLRATGANRWGHAFILKIRARARRTSWLKAFTHPICPIRFCDACAPRRAALHLPEENARDSETCRSLQKIPEAGSMNDFQKRNQW